jgi:tetratricopeptide (TPR) repeat protein
MIEKIKEAIQKDSLVIFVGAGMSIPLKFPNWTNLVLNILEKINEKSKFHFAHYIEQGKSIDVFETLNELEHHGYNSKVKNALYEEIKKIEFNESNLDKHKKLWEISEKIITTNYDRLLEEVKPKRVETYSNGNEFQQSKSIQGSPFLYKIHGDIGNPDKCILFESDYKNIYENDSSDLNTLKSFFLNKTILFVGFSLNDPYVTNQMKYLSDLYKVHNQEHYVLQTVSEDFSTYNVKSILIEDWNSAFDVFLDKLIKEKKETSKVLLVENNSEDKLDINSTEDLILLQSMFDEKKEIYKKEDDLKKKGLLKELHKIKNRIQEVQDKNLELDFDFHIPSHKEDRVESLFDIIYGSEKLSPQIISDIQKIKEQHSKDYSWYQRSVIVSALACSIINHKKLDPNKIELLIDFTNDSEEKVWQKALTYLFLTLNHLGQKWLRYPSLKIKIKRLKDGNDIQRALKVIIELMQYELQNITYYDKRIFENEYFKKSPFNYFMPFYNDNPSVENLYDNEKIEDVESFEKYLYNIPISDSAKYLMCNSPNFEAKKAQKNLNQKEIEELTIWSNNLRIHKFFDPYLNYVNEFLNFYENYPNQDYILKQDVSIITVKNLKNVLLNTVEQHRAFARQFYIQKDFGKAIGHYEQMILIAKDDVEGLGNLIDCLNQIKADDDRVLEHSLQLFKISPNNHKNLALISTIYIEKKKYKTSLNFINKAIELKKSEPIYYFGRGIIEDNLDNYKNAIIDFDKAIELGEVSDGVYHARGISNYNLKKYKESILDFDKAISIDNNNHAYFGNRADSHIEMFNYELALKDLDVALKLAKDLDDILHYMNNKGNSYRKLKDFKSAHNIISNDILRKDKDGKLNGTKAAIYSTEGKDDKFYEYAEQAFKLKAKASWFNEDIKEKYRNDNLFQDLLRRYNQKLK